MSKYGVFYYPVTKLLDFNIISKYLSKYLFYHIIRVFINYRNFW